MELHTVPAMEVEFKYLKGVQKEEGKEGCKSQVSRSTSGTSENPD